MINTKGRHLKGRAALRRPCLRKKHCWRDPPMSKKGGEGWLYQAPGMPTRGLLFSSLRRMQKLVRPKRSPPGRHSGPPGLHSNNSWHGRYSLVLLNLEGSAHHNERSMLQHNRRGSQRSASPQGPRSRPRRVRYTGAFEVPYSLRSIEHTRQANS